MDIRSRKPDVSFVATFECDTGFFIDDSMNQVLLGSIVLTILNLLALMILAIER